MLIRNPALNETHFLSSFIRALKEEIRFVVKLFKPTTMKVAIEKARMQELAIEAAQKRGKATSNRSNYTMSTAVANMGQLNPAVRNNAFRISPEVYEYRKTNHLCFRCGEKFGPGHVCRMRQLNCLVGEIEDEPYMRLLTAPEEEPRPPEVLINVVLEQEVQ